MSTNAKASNVFRDPEFWAILLFNAFIVLSFVLDAASAKGVILLYFIQSVLIGVQTFLRMLARGFALPGTSGFAARFGLPFFFMFHYGFFHLIYLVFVVTIISKITGQIDPQLITGFAWFMVFNLVLSLISDIKKDRDKSQQPIGIMFQPYLRIIPMHIFIMIGFSVGEDEVSKAFLVFMALKTFADLLMHIVVNKTYQERRPKAVEGWI